MNVLFPLLAAYVDPRSGEQALPPPPVHDSERSVKRLLEDSGPEGGREPMDLDMILDRVIQHAQNEAMSSWQVPLGVMRFFHLCPVWGKPNRCTDR